MVDSFTVNPFTLSLSSAMVMVVSMLNMNKFYVQNTSAAYAKPSFLSRRLYSLNLRFHEVAKSFAQTCNNTMVGNLRPFFLELNEQRTALFQLRCCLSNSQVGIACGGLLGGCTVS